MSGPVDRAVAEWFDAYPDAPRDFPAHRLLTVQMRAFEQALRDFGSEVAKAFRRAFRWRSDEETP